LANAVCAKDLRPATEIEIRASGAIPGYASPIGLRDVFVVVDDAVAESANLITGANEEGYHLKNTNYGRDYSANLVLDIASAKNGDACVVCGHAMRSTRGVEVGNIFQLGTKYSEALGCFFLDRDMVKKPVVMGSYGIGIGRLLACIAEEHHDEQGLMWPAAVAPYQVHLIVLGAKSSGSEIMAEAEKVYSQLCEAGMEVLFDDRLESPGVKFNDADLIGLPLRVTISDRSIKHGGVEFKMRWQNEREIIPLREIEKRLTVEIIEILSTSLDKK
jgi:prolyl-tRNA synthetase